jgi:hypothetical protein
MQEIVEKLVRATTQLESVLPAIEGINRNQSEQAKAISALQTSLGNVAESRRDCERRERENILEIFRKIEGKVNKADIDLEELAQLKQKVKDIQRRTDSGSNKAWDLAKIVITAFFSAVLAVGGTLLIQAITRGAG